MATTYGYVVIIFDAPVPFPPAFSVSKSNVQAVTAYLSDQAQHHRKFSYQEELRELLKRHRVASDERFLWE